MTSTYVPIAYTSPLDSNPSVITFSNIPANYTHLVLVISPRFSSSGAVAMSLNGDATVANYIRLTVSGSNTNVASSAPTTNLPRLSDGMESGSIVVHFLNYSSPIHKSIYARSGAGSAMSRLTAIRWANNAAITNIQLSAAGSTSFQSNSTFALYGIVS